MGSLSSTFYLLQYDQFEPIGTAIASTKDNILICVSSLTVQN